jgi:hypothetical protein
MNNFVVLRIIYYDSFAFAPGCGELDFTSIIDIYRNFRNAIIEILFFKSATSQLPYKLALSLTHSF